MAAKQSPVTWAGAKSQHADLILPHLEGYEGFVEVFGGSGEMLLQRQPTKLEVFNDIDSELVNFFRVVRFHEEELLSVLEWMPNSREEFYDFVEHKGLTDIQRAARWFKRNKLGMGADMEHCGTSRGKTSNLKAYRSNRWEKIEWLNDRLDRVAIENLDWKECLSKYDREGTVFFCDPPYLDTEGGGSSYDAFDEEEHRKLAESLKGLEGEFVLTVNADPLFEDLYEEQTVRPFSQSYRIDGGTQDEEAEQLLITSN